MNRQKSYLSDSAKLYLVATPIGNLADITYRAVETLKTVEVCFAEDTRVTRVLFEHYNIQIYTSWLFCIILLAYALILPFCCWVNLRCEKNRSNFIT